MESCGNCKFWGGCDEGDNVQRCRRYPPKFWMSDGFTEEDIVDPSSYEWPYTRIDWWCGEHKVESA